MLPQMHVLYTIIHNISYNIQNIRHAYFLCCTPFDVDNMHEPYRFLKGDKKIGKIGPFWPDSFPYYFDINISRNLITKSRSTQLSGKS